MILNNNSIHPLTGSLVDWYSINKRDLPWRTNPKPYNVWLSEIIFQQTKIEQGIGYYERIVNKFPSVYDLARASEDEVLKAWEGLGYYSRARNLHHSAKVIVNDFNGDFPKEYKDILALKGVGPYTAAAISSIAFEEPYPAIDGNVLRVASRLFLIQNPIDAISTRKRIEEELNSIIDFVNPGDFNQAMMELGALVCKPQKPLCDQCPVSHHCLAFKENLQSELPIKKKKVKVKEVFFNFLVFHTESSILIEKRKDGIWKGMYQFPLKEDNLIQEDEIIIEYIQSVFSNKKLVIEVSKIYKHILSHRIIYAKFYLIKVDSLDNFNGYEVIYKEDLSNYPLPRLIHRFLSSETAKQNNI